MPDAVAATPLAALAPDRLRTALDRTALGAILLLPPLLLHAHGIAEVAIAIAGACFLAHAALTRDWAWARAPWALIGWAFWGWQIICSLPVPAWHLGEGGARSLVQGLVFGRFLFLIATIEVFVLRTPERRRWMYWVIAGSAAYIAIHALVQYATGYNLYGEPVNPAGELTGPFGKPRAGPAYAHVLLPAVIPAAAGLLAQKRTGPRVWGMAVLIGGVAVSLLIGQRMPFLLTGLGLLVCGLLLPRLRPAVAIAAVATGVLLLASPVVAPKAWFRLVEHFSAQMSHFSTSHYGKLYARALEIGERNPVTGLGAEGYRTGCADPLYFRPSFDGSLPDGGGAEICWNHPHNYYLEALTIGGVPELLLLAALAVALLRAVGQGLWRTPDPVRAGLFAAAVIEFWPIASTTGFTAMPIAGWSFLLLGWGLAEARWKNQRPDPI